MKVKIDDIHKYIKYGSMPDDVYNRMERAMLRGNSEIEISLDEMAEMKDDFEKYDRYDQLLHKTTNRNNFGIEQEKNGKIEDAIKVYEENVKDGFPATHSFNRLIILYKRLKRPLDEKRICEEYIRVFSSKNDEVFRQTIKKYPEYENEITEAHRLNTSVKGYSSLFGREVFLLNPCPVLKYTKRLEKLNLSLTKKHKP